MRALCVRHDAFSSPDLIGAALRAQGWQVDELLIVPAESHGEPNVSASFPDSRDYDLIVPLGAPWSAYDDARIGNWLRPELRWLAGTVEAGGAVLGICFGAQALARALGGAVSRSDRPEIGWVRVDSSSFIAEGPWFQWHFDRFTPPPGAEELARNAAAVQAYRVGRSLGVQFHPEVTAAGIGVWLDNGGAIEAQRLGIDPAELIGEAERQADAARTRADTLVAEYLKRIF